jgi:hypothetical protein
METPSTGYIISRSLFILVLIIAFITGHGFYKKMQRRAAIIAELQSITSDSSFFQQFYAADANKSLVRAVGLIAEANSLGLNPVKTIASSMGVKSKLLEGGDKEDEPARQIIIRRCLRNNYEIFLRLGYTADAETLEEMKSGKLPRIPFGPGAGKMPEIVNLVHPDSSPGIEKVIANLEIRPPTEDDRKPGDVEIAAAKQLARDLSEAKIIDQAARERILKYLSTPAP